MRERKVCLRSGLGDGGKKDGRNGVRTVVFYCKPCSTIYLLIKIKL